jgi:hypothetical protein
MTRIGTLGGTTRAASSGFIVQPNKSARDAARALAKDMNKPDLEQKIFADLGGMDGKGILDGDLVLEWEFNEEEEHRLDPNTRRAWLRSVTMTTMGEGQADRDGYILRQDLDDDEEGKINAANALSKAMSDSVDANVILGILQNDGNDGILPGTVVREWCRNKGLTAKVRREWLRSLYTIKKHRDIGLKWLVWELQPNDRRQKPEIHLSNEAYFILASIASSCNKSITEMAEQIYGSRKNMPDLRSLVSGMDQMLAQYGALYNWLIVPKLATMVEEIMNFNPDMDPSIKPPAVGPPAVGPGKPRSDDLDEADDEKPPSADPDEADEEEGKLSIPLKRMLRSRFFFEYCEVPTDKALHKIVCILKAKEDDNLKKGEQIEKNREVKSLQEKVEGWQDDEPEPNDWRAIPKYKNPAQALIDYWLSPRRVYLVGMGLDKERLMRFFVRGPFLRAFLQFICARTSPASASEYPFTHTARLVTLSSNKELLKKSISEGNRMLSTYVETEDDRKKRISKQEADDKSIEHKSHVVRQYFLSVKVSAGDRTSHITPASLRLQNGGRGISYLRDVILQMHEKAFPHLAQIKFVSYGCQPRGCEDKYGCPRTLSVCYKVERPNDSSNDISHFTLASQD